MNVTTNCLPNTVQVSFPSYEMPTKFYTKEKNTDSKSDWQWKRF